MVTVLDIETIPPPAAELNRELREVKPAANIKDPKKIQANVEKKQNEMREKAALLDSAPVHTIGIKDQSGTAQFTCCELSSKEEAAFLSLDIQVIKGESEERILEDFADYLDGYPDTELITFNGRRFDLPKIRMRMARHRIPIPDVLCRKQQDIDLMIEYIYNFSMGNGPEKGKTPFISMSTVLQQLDIASEGKQMSGARYPELVAEGRFVEALVYNYVDLIMTESIMLRIL